MHVLEALSERIPGGFFVYSANEDGKLLYANAAVIGMFGCETLEAFMKHVGGSFSALVHPLDVERVQESIHRQTLASEEKLSSVVYRIQQNDGTVRWVEHYARFVRTEQSGDVYYVFLADITAKKLAEDAVLLCEKRLNEAKNRLIFSLSHDIRTPMNAILGHTDQARKDLNDNPSVQDHLQKVTSAGKLLLSLTNDLLELSEFDDAVVHPQMEKQNLSAVVCDTVDMMRSEFEAKCIDVTVNQSHCDTKVFMEAPRFQRALLHILAKALKVTPQSGKIDLSLQEKERSKDGYVCFEIIIAEIGAEGSSEMPAIQDETDLDVRLIKRIMDVLGGTVTVSSEKGKGFTCTLSLTLKLADGVLDTLPTSEPLHRTANKRRILLVEDIEISRLLTETVLTESGFDVESVPDGRVAVEAVSNKPEGYYAAVLMDIQMPVMNGYEATKAIRALNRKDVFSLPIIALSSNARMDDKVLSYESGMNEHLTKPFDAEGLIATLNKYAREK